MLESERKIIFSAWQDFERLKRASRFTAVEEARLVEDITALLGVYDLRFNDELYTMIAEMIKWGKMKGANVLGAEVELARIRQRHRQEGSVIDTASGLRRGGFHKRT